MNLKIRFVDFWPGFQPETFYLYKVLLKTGYEIVLDDKNPDIIFGSVFGNQIDHLLAKKKIIYTGENKKADFRKCDYYIGFEFSQDSRYLRLPIYQLHWGNSTDEQKECFYKKDISKRKKFCAFIHSNPNANKRNEFLDKLSKYKKVDSGGAAFNNIGYLVSDKLEWLKEYKFCMCFENFSEYGYLTEKLIDGMMGGCIPIYWGSESCKNEFNEKSFINWHKYGNDEDVIQKIIELDNNNDSYMEVYREPYLIEDKPNEYMSEERIINFFKKIIKE